MQMIGSKDADAAYDEKKGKDNGQEEGGDEEDYEIEGNGESNTTLRRCAAFTLEKYSSKDFIT